MKIFVISLRKHHTTRLPKLIEQLNRLKLEATIIQGIDGETLSDESFVNGPSSLNSPWVTRGTHVALTKGEVGCALSHFEAWTQCVKLNQNVIILEDDVTIDPSFDIVHINQLFSKYSNLQFMYLGRKRIEMTSLNQNIEEIFGDVNDGLVVPKYSYWACGYAITPAGAKSLLTANRGILMTPNVPLDEILPFAYGSTPYATYLTQLYNGLQPGFLKACALTKLVVFPKNGAFSESGTFFSSPSRPYGFSSQLRVFTVSTMAHEGLSILQETCERYGIILEVLGMNTIWDGGDMIKGTGGARKILELDQCFKTKIFPNTQYFAFVDGFDVFANDGATMLIKLIEKYSSQNLYSEVVIFGSENNCWPDKHLQSTYRKYLPQVTSKFLNSGVFAGTANTFRSLVNMAAKEVRSSSDDDQRIYTKIFLNQFDKPESEKLNIVLDINQELCVCIADFKDSLYSSVNQDLRNNCVSFKSNDSEIRPIFVHGNGNQMSKFQAYALSDYCGAGRSGVYNEIYGSNIQELIDTAYSLSFDKIPTILIVTNGHLDKESSTIQFITDFVNAVTAPGIFSYPGSKILYGHLTEFETFDLLNQSNNVLYPYVKDDFKSFVNSVFLAILECENKHSRPIDLVFFMSNNVVWDFKSLLLPKMFCELVAATMSSSRRKKSVFVSPLLMDESKTASSLKTTTHTGRFCVPFVREVFMCDASLFKKTQSYKEHHSIVGKNVIEIKFCKNIFETHGVIPRVLVLSPLVNGEVQPRYGHLCNDILTIDRVKQRLTSMGSKGSRERVEWEKLYMTSEFVSDPQLGPEIFQNLHSNHVFTKTWCDDVLLVMTSSKDWSNSTGSGNESKFDSRINRTELYPTDDCQLFSTGLDKMWKTIVFEYIGVAMSKEYKYTTKDINLAFTARFSKEGQRELVYHHDSSTYTVDVCLNSEFGGGGVQYERSGTIVCPKIPGMMLTHPGRITHRHRSLPVTEGTRYILVSFIN